MIACIEKAICALLALILEKTKQLDELILQGEANCEKLDAVLDPDTECPLCPEADCKVKFWWGDSDTGVFDAAYVHNATVNGTAVSTPLAGQVSKGSVYAPTMAEANAVTGATVSLTTDVALTDNGKPEYLAELDAGTTLTIVNGHTGGGGQILTITATEEGCTATFTDGDENPITSFNPEIL